MSYLPYSRFLATLDDLGLQHPDVRKLADAAAAFALAESVATLSTPANALAERNPESKREAISAIRPGVRPGAGSATGLAADSAKRPKSGRESTRRINPVLNQHKALEKQDPALSVGSRATSSKAEKHYKTKAGAKSEKTTPAPQEKDDDVTAVGFQPNDQRLLVLLQKYILVKSEAGREVRVDGGFADVSKIFSEFVQCVGANETAKWNAVWRPIVVPCNLCFTSR